VPVLICIGIGILFGAGEFLVHADPLERSGAVVLLSGGGNERMDEAARLMRERYSDLLILTDTAETMPDGMLTSTYMRLEAIDKGVSPAQIQLTDHVVGSTRDEARAVEAYLNLHQVKSCLVVTDPFHTQRTRLIFRNQMKSSGIDVRVVPSSGHWYRAGSWFLSLRGWQATISEYAKLTYYLLGKQVD
jgi:uncharacterized SAM-binding protein YcdF (DUF218 family)